MTLQTRREDRYVDYLQIKQKGWEAIEVTTFQKILIISVFFRSIHNPLRICSKDEKFSKTAFSFFFQEQFPEHNLALPQLNIVISLSEEKNNDLKKHTHTHTKGMLKIFLACES